MGRVFPLAGLLRLRELQEKRAAGKLASANSALHGGQERVLRVRDTVAASTAEPVDADALLAIAAARASSRSMLLELNALVESQATHVLNAETDYLQARGSAAMLQKLAEKHEVMVRTEDLAREQLLLDDLGTRQGAGRAAS
ncbi:hypothetical protein [Paeniglutamicibacter cryotolerans]